MRPSVQAFFDEATNSVSYLVADPATGQAAVIDSLLDFELASGRTSRASADRLLEAARQQGLAVAWVLETHVHADHLSAAPYIRRVAGGRLGIGAGITAVQGAFGRIFNLAADCPADGRQFDRLFADGETFDLGSIPGRVLATPGHTPACVTYVIGDAAFVGDTLFMPDYGTARCDFPGGSAAQLYRSIQRLYGLPPATRLFLCHDYKAPGRDDFRWETTVAEQRAANIHLRDGVSEEAFVALREARDRTLSMPKLLFPAVQVNMRGGNLPTPEDNGVSYLKIPVDRL